MPWDTHERGIQHTQAKHSPPGKTGKRTSSPSRPHLRRRHRPRPAIGQQKIASVQSANKKLRRCFRGDKQSRGCIQVCCRTATSRGATAQLSRDIKPSPSTSETSVHGLQLGRRKYLVSLLCVYQVCRSRRSLFVLVGLICVAAPPARFCLRF